MQGRRTGVVMRVSNEQPPSLPGYYTLFGLKLAHTLLVQQLPSEGCAHHRRVPLTIVDNMP